MPKIENLSLDVITVVRGAGLNIEGQPQCLTSHDIAEQLGIEDYESYALTLLGVVDKLVELNILRPAIKGRGGENPETVYYDPKMEKMLVAAGVLSRNSWVLEIKPVPAAEGHLATIWFTEEEFREAEVGGGQSRRGRRPNR